LSHKLVILHVDGLSANALHRALEAGHMPFLRRLIDEERYEAHPYRCGLPSTTPFAQAGILYGDNSEIPSFRWWDRERRVLVKFGAGSTFKKVADKYFQGCKPLTQGGACIAACYPAGAADDFGIAYHDRTYGVQDRSRSAFAVLLPYLANPVHIGDWAWQTAAMIGRTGRDYVTARSEGRRPAPAYVAVDLVEEIFVHHLTRYAVTQAMREGYSPIYAGFYAYDETAHAFGPADPASQNVLRHVDHTIGKVADARKGRYELVVLSDHGQVETAPFPLARMLEKLLPGQLVVAASGGLAHVYVKDSPHRLSLTEVKARFPQLVAVLTEIDEVALLMARDGAEDVMLSKAGDLSAYDEPDVLRAQLRKLNSFANAGDLIVFGAWRNDRQVNFEEQAGGHGSIGGEQLRPFLLAKQEWGIDTSRVRGAHELHPILRDLRDRLAND
jgi:type I phosphodiesterase/nucleotide pyrophosphatase